MKGAQANTSLPKEQNVDTIFGYPGGMILPSPTRSMAMPDTKSL